MVDISPPNVYQVETVNNNSISTCPFPLPETSRFLIGDLSIPSGPVRVYAELTQNQLIFLQLGAPTEFFREAKAAQVINGIIHDADEAALRDGIEKELHGFVDNAYISKARVQLLPHGNGNGLDPYTELMRLYCAYTDLGKDLSALEKRI